MLQCTSILLIIQIIQYTFPYSSKQAVARRECEVAQGAERNSEPSHERGIKAQFKKRRESLAIEVDEEIQ